MHYLKLTYFTLGIEEKMKKILHILLISFFSFNIISCDTTTIMLGAAGGGAAYWYKDDISTWYDDFSKESDNRIESAKKIFAIKIFVKFLCNIS